jgi:hypothetical protein
MRQWCGFSCCCSSVHTDIAVLIMLATSSSSSTSSLQHSSRFHKLLLWLPGLVCFFCQIIHVAHYVSRGANRALRLMPLYVVCMCSDLIINII